MLKSLEVYGFKSFADRTTFAFAPGTTCVVGPNGSGKSNVVDAMKWLLGDQSPKSLRGKNMADVIFNGSRSRKASGFAEATLSFDNSNDLLPIEYDEVRITRRLYQGGDSEYLINGETSRLKDIRELFMGTGAATSAYSIIEQGRVGQVLQGNPSTRRILFDEAAGISRFKARRIDAERKLERVSQNLLRLTDIVDEVENQLNACRSQAGKATKYRELTRSYDALWLGLAADEARRLHSHVGGMRHEVAQVSEKVSAAREQQQAVETERSELRQAFSEADEELQRIEGSLSALMQQRSSLLTSLHHQTDRSREIAAEVDTLRSQRVELNRRVFDIEQEIASVESQQRQAEEAVEQKQRERQADESQMQELVERLEQQRQLREDLVTARQATARKQAAAENHLSHLHARQETLRQAIERTNSEIEAAAAEVERRAEKTASARDVHEVALAKNDEQRAQVEQIARKRQELKDQVNQIHQRLRADREQRSAWEARLGLLEDMEKRQLGVSVGVQEILNRARRSPLPPWKHVLGILPDFFDCDFDHAPLIEIILGGGSQLVVVDELTPVLEYLRREETQFEGRVSFLQLPQGKQAQAIQASFDEQLDSQLAEEPDVIGRADRLVRCEAGYQPLLTELLGKTWIVGQLETARRLAVASPAGVQFLTMQGDLFSGVGLVQTGTLLAEGSVVSRRSEIRRIKAELQQLDRHVQRLTDKTAELDEVLARLDSDLAQAQTWLETQSSETAELRQAFVAAERDEKLALKERDRLAQDVETLRQQLTTVGEEVEHENAQQLRHEEEMDTLAARSVELEEAIRETQRLRQELVQGRSQFQMELAKLEERFAGTEAVLLRLKKDRESRRGQSAEAATRLDDSLAKRDRLELQMLQARSRLAELYLIGEQLQRDVLLARRKRQATQVERDRLNEQLKQLADVRREREQELQDLRIELRDGENELHSLAERIFEEYQYTLRDLVASGLSAHTPHAATRMGEPIEAIEYPPKSLLTNPTATEGDELDEDQAATAENHETSTGVDEASAEQSETEEEDADSNAAADADATVNAAEVSLEQLIDLDGIESIPWAWTDSEFDYDESRPQLEREIGRLRKKIKALGAVDPDSLKGLDELESRYRHLSTQLQDLQHAKATLEDIIRKINTESRRIFQESFTTIRAHFQDLFRQLFGGGEGDVVMEDDSDPLECGIEIVARPPGKELRSISLLSGGEKTMTAVGLLLAIFRSRPSPFCILDEVDAALDEANIDRFVTVLKKFQDKTQFVIITHRKRTMTAADRIFGVTMEEAGISKRLIVRFEDVGENGEINASGKAA